MNIVLPCEDLNLRIETSNRPFFRVSRFETLPVQMEVALTNIIQHELRVFKNLERLTYDMERRPDFSPLALYRTIDRSNEGRVDTVNLDVFFKQNGLNFQLSELLACIRRIDTGGNECFSFEELQDFLQEQIGFRSEQTVISMAKATPENRRFIHEDLQESQLNSVKT